MTKPKAIRLGVALATLSLVTVSAACAADPGATKDNEKDPFVFAGAGDPTSLDPSLASDGETFRVTRQVFDTLLQHEDGGDKIVGGLAKDFKPNDDGTEWKFTLNEGVKFSNGEKLTSQVVCDNYERWYNWEGNYQTPAMSTYWQDSFGGFAKNEDKENTAAPNFAGCDTDGDLDLTIKVKKPTAKLPGAFTNASMSIHAPESLKAYEKQEPKGDNPEALKYPDYSQQAGDAIGTGAYKYEKWDHSKHEVTLVANEHYWGKTKPKIKKLVFQTISKENDRKQALVSGDIDGYDLVAPQDIKDLESEDIQVPNRDPFNLMYLGMTQSQKGKDTELADKDVRKAIAHAVDKDRIIKQVYPEGTEAATQFQPPNLDGWSKDVPKYEHDTDKAKDLLKEAGKEDLKLDFCYPTEVTRPYMPSPQSIYENMKSDLEKAGITVEDRPLPWTPDFNDTTEEGGCSLYILGWTADYAEAYNFLGTWFSEYDPAWGFKDEGVTQALADVNGEADKEKRTKLYEKANEEIMEFLPGVPISHSSPSLAFAGYVDPPQTSPLTQENFAEISFK